MDYLPMLWLKLMHVTKTGPRKTHIFNFSKLTSNLLLLKRDYFGTTSMTTRSPVTHEAFFSIVTFVPSNHYNALELRLPCPNPSICSNTYIVVLYAVWCYVKPLYYYKDVIMSAMASQITSLAIVYSDADQGKHNSSASLALVWGEFTVDR